MSAKTGGPAFPNAHYNGKGGYDTSGGLTLRDYFAAKIAASIWANNELLKVLADGVQARHVASIAYEQADAMLAAREAK